jgi:hypothetical protein
MWSKTSEKNETLHTNSRKNLGRPKMRCNDTVKQKDCMDATSYKLNTQKKRSNNVFKFKRF